MCPRILGLQRQVAEGLVGSESEFASRSPDLGSHTGRAWNLRFPEAVLKRRESSVSCFLSLPEESVWCQHRKEEALGETAAPSLQGQNSQGSRAGGTPESSSPCLPKTTFLRWGILQVRYTTFKRPFITARPGTLLSS